MSWFTDTPWVSVVLFLSLSPSLLVANALEPQAPTHNRVQTLPPIAITATRLDQDIPNVGIEAEVIHLAEHRKSGHQSIHDTFSHHPYLSTSGEDGSQSLFITGLPSNQIRILVDGVDIKDAITPQGTAYPDALLFDTFDRIDIVSTGMSTLYGSDATGGVIHLISDEKSQFLRLFGRENYARFGTQWYQENCLGNWAISYATLQDKTHSSFETGQEIDTKKIYNFGLKHRVQLENITVESNHKTLYSEVDLDSDTADDTSRTLQTRQNLFGTKISLAKNSTNSPSLGYTQHSLIRKDSGYGGSIYEGKTESFTLSQELHIYDAHVLSGYEHHSEEGKSTYTNQNIQFRDSLFSRWLFVHNDITFGAGYRHQWYDGDSIGTYDLSIGTLFHDLRLKGAISTGFRVPSLYEKATNQGSTSTKNLHLLAESSLTTRLSAETPIGPFTLGITYFDNKIDNKIDYEGQDIPPYTESRYFNQTAQFHSKGFHYSIALQPFSIINVLELTYIVQDAAQGNTAAIRIPHEKWILRSVIVHDQWTLGSSLAAVSSRTDLIGYPLTSTPLDAYVDLSASLTYAWTDTISVSLTGANLLGQKIELAKYKHSKSTSLTAGINVLF
jgi:outer membrane cobalamin receptor